MSETFEMAPAKINLFLEVLKKRDDGYHEIESVMTAIPLFDTVQISENGKSTVTLDCRFYDSPYFSKLEGIKTEDNIAFLAAKRYYGKALKKGVTLPGVDIVIEKRIPVCAGLAGGSSDAAAVLRALDRLFQGPLSKAELLSLAAELGADVPFCFEGGTALCRGIGDVMTPIKTEYVPSGLLTLEKKEKLSTKVAYGAVDSLKNREIKSADRMVSSLEKGDTDAVFSELYNIFDAACGYGGTAKKILLLCGAGGAVLSGSGPSVVGLFTSRVARERAKQMLTENGYPVFEF